MAYKTGIAANLDELFQTIVTFLTTELGAAENWTLLRHCGVFDITASSFVVNFEPWAAFKGSYHQHANGWATATGQPNNSWLHWKMVVARDNARFALTGAATPSESPRDFSLEWWDAANATWRVRQAWTGITWGANERKDWTLDPWPLYDVGGVMTDLSGPKDEWRLFVTANNGSADRTYVQQVSLPEFFQTADFDYSRRPGAWLRAPGLTGLDPCFVTLQIYDRPTDDYYNIAISGATGFVDVAAIENQPGAIASLAIPLWNQPMTYWLAGNGQRFVLSAKVDTTILQCYAGKILPFGTPGQYPYPLMIAAPLSSAAGKRYSDASVALPFKGNRAQMRLRKSDGTWVNPFAWPYTATSVKTFRDTNGAYPLLPITLYDNDNTYGVLDGVRHISGFANALENTVAVGAETHIVLQDGVKNGISDFYAQRIA